MLLDDFCMPPIRGYIQKFPDWPPRARTANGTVICHNVQLYRYFVSQSGEFCCHGPLCCFSTSITKGKFIFRYDSVRKLLDTPSYMNKVKMGKLLQVTTIFGMKKEMLRIFCLSRYKKLTMAM